MWALPPWGASCATPPVHTEPMERQLVLIEEAPEWRLDEHTREVGRAGLAQARKALREALRRSSETGNARTAA